LLATATAIFITLIVISAYRQKPKTPQTRADAKEYFEFTEASALVDKERSIKGGIILIKMLYFNMTPVGGNATNIWVQPLGGNVPQGDWPYKDFLAKNETWEVSIMFRQPVDSEPILDGPYKGYYPIEVDIDCDEAKGIVTLYINPDKIVWPP